MKVKRDIIHLKKMTSDDDCFVELPPEEILSFIWELTAEIWSLTGEFDVEQRLQRDVTNLIRR